MFSALAGSVFILGIGILMACAMDGLSFKRPAAANRAAKPTDRWIGAPN